MNIVYTDNKLPNQADLVSLFSSVNWESANYPERLHAALQGSDTVLTAWDGDLLVGLVNAISDGAMVAYIHYLLVRKQYQGKGIGTGLMSRILAKYAGVRQKVLIAETKAVLFYGRLGLEVDEGFSSMHINSF